MIKANLTTNFTDKILYNLEDSLLDDAIDNVGAEKSDEENEENEDIGDEADDSNNGDDGNDLPEITEEDLQEVREDLQANIDLFNSENPSKDILELRDSLLEEYKGKSFDKDGNILGEDGNVLKSFDDLIKDIAEQEKFTTDDDGNIVDKEGNIIKSKEEIAEENSLLNVYAKNFDLKDENGKTKSYSNDDKGFEELANDVSAKKVEEFKQEFFNSNPVLREVAKHLLAGGDLTEFQKPVDYSSIDKKELSIDNKRNYIKQSYIAEGVNEARADNIIKGIKDEDIDKNLDEALEVLQSKEEEKNQKRQEALEQQEQQAQEENNKYWNTVKSTIDKGNLEGFNVPESDRTNFFNYLAIPVKNGMSQDQIDRNNSSTESQLKEAYYRFKGYKLEDIVKDGIAQKTTDNLRSRLRKTRELSGSKSKDKDNKREVEVSVDTIT